MSEIVTDCPRCRAKHVTFDVKASEMIGEQYGWQGIYESFCICRGCTRSTIFLIRQLKNIAGVRGILERSELSLAGFFQVDGHVSELDMQTEDPPEYLPPALENAFKEGARCFSASCFNASATMFRLCLDLATREFLPKEDVVGLNNKVRRDLGLRLPWLFENGKLPESLRTLSSCIKEDGNDGAHVGNLTQADAEDLKDFASILLERIYTEPKRIELADARRIERRRTSDRKDSKG